MYARKPHQPTKLVILNSILPVRLILLISQRLSLWQSPYSTKRKWNHVLYTLHYHTSDTDLHTHSLSQRDSVCILHHHHGSFFFDDRNPISSSHQFYIYFHIKIVNLLNPETLKSVCVCVPLFLHTKHTYIKLHHKNIVNVFIHSYYTWHKHT